MSESSSELLVSHDGAVQTITLNRPAVLNALDLAMHERLAAALERSARPDVRALVIVQVTGPGVAGTWKLPPRPSASGVRPGWSQLIAEV